MRKPKDVDIVLPVIKGKIPKERSLSMDEYLRFVEFNSRYIVDRDVCRKQKYITAVDVPFSL
jgi:hypothetical protein